MVGCLRAGAIPIVHRHADREGRRLPHRARRGGGGGDHGGEHRQVRACDGVQAARVGRRGRRLARARSGLAAQSEAFEAVALAADDPAIMYYTSGSTGHPKGRDARRARDLGLARVGVVLARPAARRPDVVHRGHRVEQGGDEHPLRAVELRARRCCSTTAEFEPRARLELLARHRVTVFCAAAPSCAAWSRKMSRASTSRRCVMGVRRGDRQPGDRAALGRRDRRAAPRRLRADGDADDGAELSVRAGEARLDGEAVAGHRGRALAPDGTLAPPGAPGELAIRLPHPQVMLGYWQEPRSPRPRRPRSTASSTGSPATSCAGTTRAISSTKGAPTT